MMMPPQADGFGLNQMSQTVLRDGMSNTNMFSRYNNGSARLAFNVQSILPTEQARTNFQAREFNNMNMTPILQHLGQNGTLALPDYMWNTNPDNIPTMSQLTNWGGANGGIDPYTGVPVAPLQQPQQGYPGQPPGYPPPQGYPGQPPGYPPPQSYPGQPPGYPPQQPQGYPVQPPGYPPAAPPGYPPQYSGYPPAQPYPSPYPVQAPQLYPPGLPPGLTPISTAPGQPQIYMAQPIYMGGPPPMGGQFPMMPPQAIMAPPIYMPPPPRMGPPPMMMPPPRVMVAPPIYMR
jgi:hypothetical protein